MASKLRQQILDAKDIASEQVVVSEWGVTVEVRGLSAAQLVAITKAAQVTTRDSDGSVETTTDSDALSRGLILNSTYDPETGELIFDPVTDGNSLYSKSVSALNKLAEVAQRINGMTKAAADAAEKN